MKLLPGAANHLLNHYAIELEECSVPCSAATVLLT